MPKEGKTAVVPKLRIAEFRDEPGWVTRSLGAIAKFSSGGTPSKDEPRYWNGSIPWISASSMHETIVADSELKVTPSAIGNGTRLAPKGCILILVRGSMLFNRVPICMASIDVAFNQDVKALALCTDVNEKFVLYQLIAVSTRIPVNGTGIGAGKIETDVLTDLPIHLPSLAEQQKIADCLSSLDESIAAQARKVEALKTYKRGLMQQLFPREGETRPRLRFPEFRDAPEWKEVRAGTLFANRLERGDDSLPIYSVTMTDGLVKRASLDRRIDDLAEFTGNKKAYRYDIAYNMMRMWQGACGVAGEECMVSPAYVVLAPQSDVHAPFYGCLFKLPNMLRVFTAHSRGLTEDRLRLYYQDFSSILLPQPDVREQERIADCLMALDARIFDESEKLGDLKTHKSGLLQQLFPSLEAA